MSELNVLLVYPACSNENIMHLKRSAARARGLSFPTCAHLSLSVRLLCSASGWNELRFQLKHRCAEITALLSLSYVLILFDFIRRRHDYKSGFFNILEGRASYVALMGRVSVTISYSSRCLTKYINENGFIENLAAQIYSMWHRDREANKCNNKCTFPMYRRSELPCPVKM